MYMIHGVIIPILSLVAIFLFSVHKFSDHMQRLAGERFKSILRSFTSTPGRGFGIGVLFTSLIQSSTATTVILVSLVHAGLLSFRSTLGVVFGANVGSTITSQLVAMNVGNIAPYLVLFGFLITFSKKRFREFGKLVFYFGLMFFSLFLVSVYLEPIKENREVLDMLSHMSSFPIAVFAGFVLTAVIQSSGVVSGMIILLVGNGLMGFDQAFGMIIGANIGTTVTALIASVFMNIEAKKVAFGHFMFNLIGLFLFFPIQGLLLYAVDGIGGSVSQQVANAHLIFNVTCGILFLIFINPFGRFIDWIGNILFSQKARS